MKVTFNISWKLSINTILNNKMLKILGKVGKVRKAIIDFFSIFFDRIHFSFILIINILIGFERILFFRKF